MNTENTIKKRRFFTATGTAIASSVLGMVIVVSAKSPVENFTSDYPCNDYKSEFETKEIDNKPDAICYEVSKNPENSDKSTKNSEWDNEVNYEKSVIYYYTNCPQEFSIDICFQADDTINHIARLTNINVRGP